MAKNNEIKQIDFNAVKCALKILSDQGFIIQYKHEPLIVDGSRKELHKYADRLMIEAQQVFIIGELNELRLVF